MHTRVVFLSFFLFLLVSKACFRVHYLQFMTFFLLQCSVARNSCMCFFVGVHVHNYFVFRVTNKIRKRKRKNKKKAESHAFYFSTWVYIMYNIYIIMYILRVIERSKNNVFFLLIFLFILLLMCSLINYTSFFFMFFVVFFFFSEPIGYKINKDRCLATFLFYLFCILIHSFIWYESFCVTKRFYLFISMFRTLFSCFVLLFYINK